MVSVMRRFLKKSLLLLALLGVVFGMPGRMLATAAPIGQAQSVMNMQQSGGCMDCHMQANGGAPHHGSMGGMSCVGAASCAMPAMPSATVAVISPRCDIQPIGPDGTGGRSPCGPGTRPPIANA
jgi:hypothetical protein